jgi:hypothetical protein
MTANAWITLLAPEPSQQPELCKTQISLLVERTADQQQ